MYYFSPTPELACFRSVAAPVRPAALAAASVLGLKRYLYLI